jgi:hypothetical protein
VDINKNINELINLISVMTLQIIPLLKKPFRQKELLLLILTSLVTIVPFLLLPSKNKTIESLCPQYILISTALMAIIFAALSIKHEKTDVERLKFPLFLSTISLFTDIYTYFLYCIDSNQWGPIILFSIATILIFALILEIALMAATLIFTIEKQSAVQ